MTRTSESSLRRLRRRPSRRAPGCPPGAIVAAAVTTAVLAAAHGRGGRHDERGQATAEYALVILGAALLAVLLIAWATAGGGAGRIGRLFDAVLDAILQRVS